MKKIILFVILLISLSQSRAYSAALNSFSIQSQYLNSNGQVNVATSPTSITFDFSITRSLESGTTNYEQVNWVVTLVYTQNGVETALSTPKTVVSTDFNGNYYMASLTASIPATDIVGMISLKYSYYDFTNSVTIGPVYSYTTYNINNTYNPNGGTVTYPNPPSGSGYIQPADAIPSQLNNNVFNYIDQAYMGQYNNVSNIAGTPIRMSDSQPVLTPGQSIYSPNNNYRLTLQTDGNLVIYKKNTDGSETPLWSARTQNQSVASLYFQTDGNLVLYNYGSPTSPGTSPWSSGLYSLNGLGSVHYGFYSLQNDGNLVFYWPSLLLIAHYDPYTNTYGPNTTENCYIVMGASDTDGGRVSSHPANLNHSPLWNSNRGAGYDFTN